MGSNPFFTFVSNWHEKLQKTKRNENKTKTNKQRAANATIVGRSPYARNSKGVESSHNFILKLRHEKFRNWLKHYTKKKMKSLLHYASGGLIIEPRNSIAVQLFHHLVFHKI